MTILPHSAPVEQHVLAVCLLDEGQTLARARESGITDQSFYLPENRTIWRAFDKLPKPDLTLLIPELGDDGLKAIGGAPYLFQITDGIGTTAHAGLMIERLRSLEQKRHLIRQATDLIEHAQNGTDISELSELVNGLKIEIVPRGTSPKTQPITAHAYPADSDPNILLGVDDYLGRGGGFLFVSHAGAGKSSWIMDACMMWALGRPWMGIRCARPLKTLIIQAEDSDRYVGKIVASFSHVNHLTESEKTSLGANCLMVRLKGVSGQAFFSAVSALTKAHAPDLVVINPIYLYAEGDITRSEFAQPFLLGLDHVNREEKFAYILIHHTGKPSAKGNNGKRAEVEDWESAYMGFGSSYLANWPRCTALLEPVAGNPGHYQIKLGKGGLNAGITQSVPQGAGTRQEPCTRIAIRHSREKMQVAGRDRAVFYWELDDATPEEAKGKGGRPSKYKIEDHLRFIPVSRETADTAPKLHRAMNGASGIPSSSWSDLLLRSATEGKIVLSDIPGKGPCYWRKIDKSTETTETHGNPPET